MFALLEWSSPTTVQARVVVEIQRPSPVCVCNLTVRGRLALGKLVQLVPVILKAAPSSGFSVSAKTSALLRCVDPLPLPVAMQLLDGAFPDPAVRVPALTTRNPPFACPATPCPDDDILLATATAAQTMSPVSASPSLRRNPLQYLLCPCRCLIPGSSGSSGGSVCPPCEGNPALGIPLDHAAVLGALQRRPIEQVGRDVGML